MPGFFCNRLSKSSIKDSENRCGIMSVTLHILSFLANILLHDMCRFTACAVEFIHQVSWKITCFYGLRSFKNKGQVCYSSTFRFSHDHSYWDSKFDHNQDYAVRKLLDLQPRMAKVIRGEEKVIRKSGQRVATEGIVIEEYCPCRGMRLRLSPVNKRDRNRLREINGLEQLGQIQKADLNV